MIHAVKTDSMYFKATAEGIKSFEIRKNDRPYQPGDYIALNEWKDGKYTGRCTMHRIVYVLSDEEYCKKGYVVLGIMPCSILNNGTISAKIYKRGGMKVKDSKQKIVCIGKGRQIIVIPSIGIVWNCNGIFLAFAWINFVCSILVFDKCKRGDESER